MVRKFDDAEGAPIFSKKIESRTKIRKLFKLFVCKLIFQGKIDCGIMNGEKSISPLWDMDACYKNFYEKLNNIAYVPLDALSIFYARNRSGDDFEDVFKDFLQYLNIIKKQGCGVLFTLAGENRSLLLGDCVNTDGTRITLPVRIAEHGPDRYVRLAIVDEEKTWFFCENSKGEIFELPVSMQFCESFKLLLEAYDPTCTVPREIYREGCSTLIGMAGGIFLLFLESHGIINCKLFGTDNQNSVLDKYNAFVVSKCDAVLEYFERYLFIRKESFRVFMNSFEISKLENYYEKPMDPFRFEYKTDLVAGKYVEVEKKVKILQSVILSRHAPIPPGDCAIIEAEIHRVKDKLGIKAFYKEYGGKILEKDSNDTDKNFWGRFNYNLAGILEKYGINDYKVNKFSHGNRVRK